MQTLLIFLIIPIISNSKTVKTADVQGLVPRAVAAAAPSSLKKST